MSSGLMLAKRLFGGDLARMLVLRLGLVLLVVIAPLTWLAYENSLREVQQRSRDELNVIVASRAHEAAELFAVAERHTAMLRDEYLRRLRETPLSESRRFFAQWFERYPDGLVRVRRALDDHRVLPNVYLRPQVPLNDDVMHRTWVSFQLLREWGPIATARYYSAYFDLPGEGLVMYSPSVNWGAEATPETNNFDYPPVAGASPLKNPKRANQWTPVYFDDKARIYMVSTVTPIDQGHRWIACVSQDVAIDDLLRRTDSEALPGTYNVIISRNGELVAHPDFAEKFKATQGNPSLSTLKDALLDEMAALPVARDGSVALKPSLDGRFVFGAANIAGPDWIFVTVMPAALIEGRALLSSRSVLAGGGAALAVLLALLYWVVRVKIGRPLVALQHAAQRLEQGDFAVRLDRSRKDELGRLAGAFDDMGRELQSREARLQQQLERMQASEQRFRLIFDHSPTILALIGDADGRVADVNSSALLAFGMRRDDVLGHHVFELPLWTGPMQWRPLLRLLVGAPEVHDAQIALRAADGKALIVMFSRIRILADGNSFSLVAMRDVTALRQAEAAAEQLQGQLRESQKMEAVGTLAGGIAHDFNNIIGAMLGNLWLARADLPASHPAAAVLEPVWRGALRARDLVRQILTFSRRNAQTMQPLALGPVLQEAASMLRPMLPAGVLLDVALAADPGEPLVVRADETQIQQVVMNLCTNAWHALPGAKGRIELRLQARRFEADTPGRPEALAPGEYAVISVGDNGIGMDPATRQRIFEPFFTTKPVGQGTGLGLAVVHGIVRSHQGLIDVSSVEGEGSRFDVYLPLVHPSTQATAGSPSTQAATAPVPGGGAHVIYIDDDEVMMVMAQRLLERAGFKVSAFSIAAQAMASLRAQPEAFAAVVTDYNMPGMNGADVVAAIRALRPGLPVIVVSGYVDERLAATAAGGAWALLYKEDAFDQLAPLVRRVIDGERPLAATDVAPAPLD